MKPAKSNSSPHDSHRPPPFHANHTTAGADTDVRDLCPEAPWPACQLVASIPAGGTLVVQGENDVSVDLVIAAGIPFPWRGSIKTIKSTSTTGIKVALSWASR